MVCPTTSTGLPRKLLPGEVWRLAAWVASALAIAVPALSQVNPLPPDKAFTFTARALNPQTVEAKFAIADGYYLYRDKIRFSVDPATAGLTVSPLPEGKTKEDPFFGKVETYRGRLIVNLSLRDSIAGQKITIQAESQGCADIGICYPPQVQRVTVPLPAASAAPTREGEAPKKSWFN